MRPKSSNYIHRAWPWCHIPTILALSGANCNLPKYIGFGVHSPPLTTKTSPSRHLLSTRLHLLITYHCGGFSSHQHLPPSSLVSSFIALSSPLTPSSFNASRLGSSSLHFSLTTYPNSIPLYTPNKIFSKFKANCIFLHLIKASLTHSKCWLALNWVLKLSTNIVKDLNNKSVKMYMTNLINVADTLHNPNGMTTYTKVSQEVVKVLLWISCNAMKI